MLDVVGWFASAATIVAAILTAANLGTRVTGWGFVIFTIGSLGWSAVGLLSGETSLVVTNGFLVLVNLAGVWRWLGQQSRYEQGGKFARARSRGKVDSPDLYSGGQLIGAKVTDCNGGEVGVVIDYMLERAKNRLAYIVIGQGGIAGAGETLRALAPSHFRVDGDYVRCSLDQQQIEDLEPINPKAWPAVAPEPHKYVT